MTRESQRLPSHYLFEPQFCLVRWAKEKGHVERLLDFTRKNYLVPVSQVEIGEQNGPRPGMRSARKRDQRTTCYVIDSTRSGQPAEDLLGRDWSGTLVHDGWSVYDRFAQALGC